MRVWMKLASTLTPATPIAMSAELCEVDLHGRFFLIKSINRKVVDTHFPSRIVCAIVITSQRPYSLLRGGVSRRVSFTDSAPLNQSVIMWS